MNEKDSSPAPPPHTHTPKVSTGRMHVGTTPCNLKHCFFLVLQTSAWARRGVWLGCLYGPRHQGARQPITWGPQAHWMPPCLTFHWQPQTSLKRLRSRQEQAGGRRKGSQAEHASSGALLEWIGKDTRSRQRETRVWQVHPLRFSWWRRGNYLGSVSKNRERRRCSTERGKKNVILWSKVK